MQNFMVFYVIKKQTKTTPRGKTGPAAELDLTNNKAQKHTRGNILALDNLEQDDLTQDCKHNENK
jgi:hypothetical protein